MSAASNTELAETVRKHIEWDPRGEAAAALDELTGRLERAEAVVDLAREYVDPARRSDDWRATEWQDRIEVALAATRSSGGTAAE